MESPNIGLDTCYRPSSASQSVPKNQSFCFRRGNRPSAPLGLETALELTSDVARGVNDKDARNLNSALQVFHPRLRIGRLETAYTQRPSSKPKSSSTFLVCSSSAISGKKVAPICCVIPPASPSCTLVLRILSRSFVLPVSTCLGHGNSGKRCQ